MNIQSEYSDEYEVAYTAQHVPVTKFFMTELIALYEKHGMALVPTYEHRVSFHDKMRVVPYNPDVLAFIERTNVIL